MQLHAVFEKILIASAVGLSWCKEILSADEALFHFLISSITERKDTWGLVQGRKPVKCKWIFQVERGSNGKTKEYKGLSIAAIFLKTWDRLQSNVCTHHITQYSSIQMLITYAVLNSMQMEIVTF